MIDDRILEQWNEIEFLNRRTIFKTIYDAMELEMIMKDSLLIYELKNNSSSIVRFPIMNDIFNNGYVESLNC